MQAERLRVLEDQCEALDAAAKDAEKLRAQLRERADQSHALHAALDDAALLRARCEELEEEASSLHAELDALTARVGAQPDMPTRRASIIVTKPAPDPAAATTTADLQFAYDAGFPRIEVDDLLSARTSLEARQQATQELTRLLDEHAASLRLIWLHYVSRTLNRSVS